MSKKPYYISTAIAYTSGKPHIGNTYEIVLADAIARYKRLTGYDVYFQTGTDEHGQKIETKAMEAGISPKEFVDNVSTQIKTIWDVMNTSYDKFVRTTDPYHEKKVQAIFKKLYNQGDIYKSEYEGMYCEPCESFFTESQLVDGKCPDCGAEVKYAKEEAYFFKLSKYAARLMEHIDSHPEFIQPEARKNEMVNNFLKPGLKDLCVSRTSFKWGIPVDFDDKHVVYVWIDALSNYITFLGYNADGKPDDDKYEKYWPADVHLIGKDILRFHTLYWPIMLMALGEELPKQVFGHPWLLLGDGKMSKSKGNVIYADDLVDMFGVDAVRYYVLREMPFSQDGTLTYEQIVERINGELVNILGNLVNRTIAMSKKYFDSKVDNPKISEEIDKELIDMVEKTPQLVEEKMNDLKVADAINLIMTLARRSNKYIDETMPWALAKDESKTDRLKTVLYNLLESIRTIGILITPFLPDTGEGILSMLGTKNTSYESILKFGGLEEGIILNESFVLFNRLDMKEVLEKVAPPVKDEKKKKSEKKKENKKEEKEQNITIDDFAKVDLRVGKILEAKKHPDADKLLVFKVEVGKEIRQIVSGVAKYFTPEELVGKNVVVVANLKPVKLRGELSEGMLLLAEEKTNDSERLVFISPEESTISGLKIR